MLQGSLGTIYVQP